MSTFAQALMVWMFAGNAGGNPAAISVVIDYLLTMDEGLPAIDVWYGRSQAFGSQGIPQTWVNVLGNVSDPDGVASLTYTLNGGSPQVITIGPDTRRLADAGDFNVELDYMDLDDGINNVVIKATDNLGNVRSSTVEVDFTDGNTWPIPYAVDWDTVSNIQDVVQVVDGEWKLVSGGVRTAQVDYDRLIAIGDIDWVNYELTVPITINGSGTPVPRDGDPGVAIITRWTGHTDDPVVCLQPHCGWLPSGPLAWWRGGELYFYDDTKHVDSGFTLQEGVRYIWKLRTETLGSGDHQYSFKVWQDGETEPTDWNLQVTEDAGEIANGSALLIAHHMDVTFGNIQIESL